MSTSSGIPRPAPGVAEGGSYLLRWRGRQEGPYTTAIIEAKLAANEIGLLHEISHDGQWLTLRDYFAAREAVLRVQLLAREAQERQAREEADRELRAREEQQTNARLADERYRASSPPHDSTSSSAGFTDEYTKSLAPNAPVCRTCGLGRLMQLKQYRMSLPVVVIGYILLVPSAIGMVLATLGLVSYLVGGGVQVSQSHTQDKGIAVLATLFGSGFCLFLLIMSFVGGVFGWLLIMKKKVLQCTHCGAVVAAS